VPGGSSIDRFALLSNPIELRRRKNIHRAFGFDRCAFGFTLFSFRNGPTAFVFDVVVFRLMTRPMKNVRRAVRIVPTSFRIGEPVNGILPAAKQDEVRRKRSEVRAKRLEVGVKPVEVGSKRYEVGVNCVASLPTAQPGAAHPRAWLVLLEALSPGPYAADPGGTICVHPSHAFTMGQIA
jgi:hypothetical protein